MKPGTTKSTALSISRLFLNCASLLRAFFKSLLSHLTHFIATRLEEMLVTGLNVICDSYWFKV